MTFHEDLLFTHRGLSGPAILQISSYWTPGTPIDINLLPDVDVAAHLLGAKQHSRKLIANELAGLVPARLADAWVAQDADWQRPVAEASDKALQRLAERLTRWELTPTGTEGYKKAEVTVGGVDTRSCPSRPWRPNVRQACTALAKWWTSPVGWAATTSSGPGPAQQPALRGWRKANSSPSPEQAQYLGVLEPQRGAGMRLAASGPLALG